MVLSFGRVNLKFDPQAALRRMAAAPKMTERQQLAIALRESMSTGVPTPGRPIAAPSLVAQREHSSTPDPEVREDLPAPSSTKWLCLPLPLARRRRFRHRRTWFRRCARDLRFHAPRQAARRVPFLVPSSPSRATPTATSKNEKPQALPEPTPQQYQRNPLKTDPSPVSRPHQAREAQEPKRRKMSRVEKELASLAPWAWDPLVGKHAPGTAMMRDFSEVVTATSSSSYLKVVAPSAAADDAATVTPNQPGLSYAEGTARKRVRSPPSSAAFAPATASKDTPVTRVSGAPRRVTPPTATGPPPPAAAATVHRARGGRRVDDDYLGGDGGGDGVGRGPEVNRGESMTPANLGKVLEEAGEREDKEAPAAAPRSKPRSHQSRKRTEGEKAPAVVSSEGAAGKGGANSGTTPAVGRKTGVSRDHGGKKQPVDRVRPAGGKENVIPASNGVVSHQRGGGRATRGALAAERAVFSEDSRRGVAAQNLVSRELRGLEPLAPAEARKQREAALLAVAAVEAAVEAEAAKPRLSLSQNLLMQFYKLTGRQAPPGVILPDLSVAEPMIEKAAEAAAAASAAAAACSNATDLARRFAVAKPRKPIPAAGQSVTPVCGIVVGPFTGSDMRRPEDFARYHAQPTRVVALGEHLAASAAYMSKKDVLEAASAGMR